MAQGEDLKPLLLLMVAGMVGLVGCVSLSRHKEIVESWREHDHKMVDESIKWHNEAIKFRAAYFDCLGRP